MCSRSGVSGGVAQLATASLGDLARAVAAATNRTLETAVASLTKPNNKTITGCSSAWLERLVWDQEVARSNRVTPIFFAFGEKIEQ